jgi:hypothetical protein
MNGNKKGKKYKFLDSFILFIGHIKVYFHTLQANTEGIIKTTVGMKVPTNKQPRYSQICRTNKLHIDINGIIDGDFVIIVIDSTGIKVMNRGLDRYKIS